MTNGDTRLAATRLDSIGGVIRSGGKFDHSTKRWLLRDLQLSTVCGIAAKLNGEIAAAEAELRVGPRVRESVRRAALSRDRLDRFLIAVLPSLFPRGVFFDDLPQLDASTKLARGFDVALPMLAERAEALRAFGEQDRGPAWLEGAYQRTRVVPAS